MENENRFWVFLKFENWNSVANLVNKISVCAPYQCIVASKLGFGLLSLPLLIFISLLSPTS